MHDEDENQDEDELELPLPPEQSKDEVDTTLANSILFIRNAIWWREVCTAVAEGDSGRVWEILKVSFSKDTQVQDITHGRLLQVWLVTFAGSGNPYYSQFLMELFCNFKWEWSELLIDAIQKNWVVNLKGQQGHFIEMDLMQEHFNFWLEDLAQHKGKQFDDVFYREVLSMNVNNFLNLKDEMEESVTLKRRSKSHGASHLDNELRVVMNNLRGEEAESYRPGRNFATINCDDLTEGTKTLQGGKVHDFITKSTITSAIMNMHTATSDETGINWDELHAGEEETEEPEELESAMLQEDEGLPGDEELLGEGLDDNTRRRRQRVPHQRMAVIDGEVYMIDSVGKFMWYRSSPELTRLRFGSLFSSFSPDPTS